MKFQQNNVFVLQLQFQLSINLVLSNYVFLRFKFRVVMFVTMSE